MCGILENKQFFGIFNTIFIMGSRYGQKTIFSRVVAVDNISGQKITIFKKSSWSEIMGAPMCDIRKNT